MKSDRTAALTDTYGASMSRRTFVKVSGVGLTLALLPGFPVSARTSDALLQPFLRIGVDSSVTVIAKHLDMGQGIWSGLASIVAEELDAAWPQVRVEGAPANTAVYKNLFFGIQTTGGSTSIANSWIQLRTAGATARAMIVRAAASRWGVSVDDIHISEGVVSDPSGRTASFGELAESAALVEVPEKVSFKSASQYKYLGKRWPRLDTRDKSTGKTVFGIDIQRPGQRVAVMLRPPQFGATLLSFEDDRARQVPGVVDIVAVPSGLAIVAHNTWAAIQARNLVLAKWDTSNAERRSTKDLQSLYRQLAESAEAISCISRENAEQSLAGAVSTLSADYEMPYLAHAAMEPLAAVCEFVNGMCEIWGGIQNQTGDQAAAARILGIPLENVILHTLYAGGSFGRRATFNSDWISDLVSVVQATQGRYPVKLMWTREDDIRNGYYRPMSLHRIKAGLDASGAIVAVEQTIVVQSFLFGPPIAGSKNAGKVDPTAIDGTIAARYDIPAATLGWVNPPTVLIPVQMFRALNFNHTTFAKEVFIDELAALARSDAVQFRLAHLKGHPRQAAVLRMAAEKIGWGQRQKAGVGLGVAVQEAEKTFVAQIAQVRVSGDKFIVERVVCVVDCGFALNPDIVRAQMEGGIGFGLGYALYGKISLKDGLVEQHNFNDYAVLRMHDMPLRIDVHIVDSQDAPTGVGEPGSTLIAAAVANALAAVVGRYPRRLPLSDFLVAA